MEKKKLILLVVLTTLALFSLLYGILIPSKVRRRLSSEPDLSQGAPRRRSLFLSTPAERLSRRSDYPSWGRNPFLPKGSQASGFGKWILDGIAWDEKSPRAVINDRIIEVGNKIGGARVVEIRKDRVVLNDGATDFELRLGRRK